MNDANLAYATSLIGTLDWTTFADEYRAALARNETHDLLACIEGVFMDALAHRCLLARATREEATR